MKELIVKPNCNNCTLNCGSKWQVLGDGQFESPDLFIIGEAPGGQEHYQHKPFVGKSGILLHKTLEAIANQTGKAFTYYVTNTVQCHPPNDRDPTKNEIINCFDRLISEIRLSKPKCIVLLGAIACDTFLNEKVTETRGKERSWNGIPLMVTWHPAFILRDQTRFPTFAKDLQVALALANGERTRDWSSPRRVQWIETVDKAIDWCNYAFNGLNGPCSIDLETWGLDPFKGTPLWIGFHFKQRNETFEMSWEVFHAVKHLFPPDYPCIVYDSRMEFKWFVQHAGIWLTDISDPLVKAHLLDERTKGNPKDLKTIGQECTGIHDWSIPVKPFIKDNMHNCPLLILEQYLAYDVEVAAEVDEILEKRLRSNKYEDLNRLGIKLAEAMTTQRAELLEKDITFVTSNPSIADAYDNIIKPATPFVRRLTARGMRLDTDYLLDMEQKYSNEEQTGLLDRSLCQLRELTGIGDFNPGSWQQVGKHLFDKLRLPQLDKRSTNEKVISELGKMFPDEPFLNELLEFRGHSKVLSTYIRGLIEKCSIDGRIHFDYYIEGTSTGRLSGDGQQIPRPDSTPFNIRNAFLPISDEHELFDADYSMLELVAGAHLSNDEELIKRINAGIDLHRYMGMLLLNKGNEIDVTKLERQFSKNANFAVMYDASVEGFMYNFKKDFPFLTEALAKKAISYIRQTFPDLYFNALNYKRFVKDHGYILTMFGRKRRFPFVTQENFNDVMKQATNTPVQSAASDICLLAGMRIEKELPEVCVQMMVHDSIVGSIPKGYDTNKIKSIMENVPFDSKVNFNVKVSTGDRWG